MFKLRTAYLTLTTLMFPSFTVVKMQACRPARSLMINSPCSVRLLQLLYNMFQEPSFAHGQFYVGVSRCGKSSGLYINAPNRTTRNVVMKKALEQKW